MRSKDPAALFAISSSLLAILATPLDLMLQPAEKKRYRNASKPKLPTIFVTGAARSGTTLVAQVLIRHLPVHYFNNLTTVFQRSPITANLIFKNLLKNKETGYSSYYGKTVRFSGPNDGLHIWDRWLGKDRTVIPEFIEDTAKHDMVQLFGAYQETFQKPFINKNNNLNTFACLVAEAIENSYFICIQRDPVYHAQSLWQARKTIHGNENVAYGLKSPVSDQEARPDSDAIKDVCRQVLFHDRIIKEQQSIIGQDRFWIISYEEFCQNPSSLVEKVSENILRNAIDILELKSVLKPFRNANERKIDAEIFDRICETLKEIGMLEGRGEYG